MTNMRIYAAAVALILCIGAVSCWFKEDSCNEVGNGYRGQQIKTTKAATLQVCRQTCQGEKSCKHWMWKRQSTDCTLFRTKDETVGFKDIDQNFTPDDITSGPKNCEGNLLTHFIKTQ